MDKSFFLQNVTVIYDVAMVELSESDSLVIKIVRDGLEFSHLREGTSPYPLAIYNTGRWTFKDDKDRSLFLQLMQTYPRQFRSAFKKCFQHKPKNNFYTITCAKRKITLWTRKINNSIWDKVYNTFYGR
jgi:hypothetical protein